MLWMIALAPANPLASQDCAVPLGSTLPVADWTTRAAVVLRVQSTCDTSREEDRIRCDLTVLESLKGSAPASLVWAARLSDFEPGMGWIGGGELVVWGSVADHDGQAHLILLEGHRPHTAALVALLEPDHALRNTHVWQLGPSVLTRRETHGRTFVSYAPFAAPVREVEPGFWRASCEYVTAMRGVPEAFLAALERGDSPESALASIEGVGPPSWLNEVPTWEGMVRMIANPDPPGSGSPGP